MNSSIVKLVLGLSLLGMLVIFASMVAVIAVALGVPEQVQVSAIESRLEAELRPGMVLKGPDRDMFYLTPEHTRRRIMDMDTFVAFGFSLADLVAVDEPVWCSLNKTICTG